MSPRFLTVVASAAVIALLLTGCSGVSIFGEAEQHGSADQPAGADSPYDTGSYSAEPHQGWPENLWEPLGPVTEPNLVAAHTLLPYEVDGAFSRGRNPLRSDSFADFKATMPDQVAVKLDHLELEWLGGYTQEAVDPVENRGAKNSVHRFESPEDAQEASHLMHEAYLADGGTDYVGGGNYPLENVNIAGHPEILAVKDEPQQEQIAIATKDEYLMVATTHNAKLDENSAVIPHDPEAMGWMGGYGRGFVDKQGELIDGMRSHKTSKGYGYTNEWLPLDPDDILRYALMPPQEGQSVGTTPLPLNARLTAGRFVDTTAVLKLYESSDIEAAGVAETILLRASTPEQAERIQAGFTSIDAKPGHFETLEPYNDPQNVPGTSCYFSPQARSTYYFCYLRHENYLAYASYLAHDPAASEPAAGEQNVDGKMKLSQMVAAQYLILQEVPTNSGAS
ncbi:DUF7373 family lipoprotein [Corynebacterium tuscaniense]|uniref:DUF7373 family lipoprotein n=1 Tax=Corynebacterium tuscaniense TaxID=302449 RepID=UPI0005107689|nr:hypothetical protein [Corynebacterium tuscaniense]KGF22708.1 hypothetical protein HMPREF2129_06695 [Corynebacterium tuscaniense DNF00037]